MRRSPEELGVPRSGIAFVVFLLVWVLFAPAASAQSSSTCAVPLELSKSRPDPDGIATEVNVGVYVIDLRSIQDSTQSFDADAFVSIVWKDPRLVDESFGPSLAGCRVPLESVWHPRAQIINDRSLKKSGPDIVMIGPDGTVRHNQRYGGAFSFAFFFGDFPVDEHDIEIEVVSFGFGPDQVEFTVDRERFGREETFSIAEWTAGAMDVAVEPLYVEPAQLELSRITFTLQVSRNTGFYLWKVFAPLCLIVMMSWAIFWISPENFPPQISVATSAVFTLIAFQFSLGYTLPRLSYLTKADSFVMGSMILVFLAFGEAVLTGRLARTDSVALAQRIDRYARWLFPLVFLGVIAFSFLI
jgi:hypothetical protein